MAQRLLHTGRANFKIAEQVMSKKALAAAVFSRSAMASVVLRLAGHRHGLRILAYHRIVDIGDEAAFPADPELVSAGVEAFRQQLAFLRDHFDILSFADVLSCLQTGAALPQRGLVVTFDDGHLDNYTHAFPVAKALGVPFTVFLSTDYIGSTKMFWFDRVALLLYAAPAGTLNLRSVAFEVHLEGIDSRRAAAGRLLSVMKQQHDRVRRECLDELEQAVPRECFAHLEPQRAAMTWDQVREMSAAGYEFGSHTVTHPILSRLDDVDIERELAESRQVIRSQTGQAADVLAYPVGKIGAYDERVIAIAKSCGYKLGISYESGTNHLHAADRFALRRLAVERYVSFDGFQAMLSWPKVFA
jgi:peptidoglycan/xylan/chitin deacetylase (PgdA/CDA1 family)